MKTPARPVDPAWLAVLHAASFPDARPWSAQEFSALLTSPGCLLAHEDQGFALARVAADDAEILTIAVRPEARRQGIGRRLVGDLERAARAAGALTLFLEVAGNNTAAVNLYESSGFACTGRRARYYRQRDGQRQDALILAKPLR